MANPPKPISLSIQPNSGTYIRHHSQRSRLKSLLAAVVFFLVAITAVNLVVGQENDSAGSNQQVKALADEAFTALLKAVDRYKSQGHFEDAKKLLENALLSPANTDIEKIDRRIELAKELDAVKALIAAKSDEKAQVSLRQAVDRYKTQGRLEDARKLLESELQKTPTIDSQNVNRRIELAKELDTVEKAIAEKERERLQSLIKQLEKAEDETEKKTLREQLRTAIQQQAGTQNTEIVVEIERALQRSEAGRLANLPGFLRVALSAIWSVAVKAVQILVEVLIYFVFLIVVIQLFRLIRQVRGRGVGLALEDEIASDDDREKENRKLNMLLAHEIYAIERGDVIGIEAGGLFDQAGTESVVGKVAKLKTMIDDTAVKVGVVSFSPRQIFVVIAQLFSPQHKYLLRGSLTRAHGMTSLTVTKRGLFGKAVKDQRYHASSTASLDDAREQVVRDVAIQFAIQNVKSVVTQDWKSLRAYLEAEDILRSECVGTQRNEGLKKALTTLQRSLRHDPSNWMARYNAGIVLRRLEKHKAAADQFDYLQKMVCSPGFRESEHYAAFRKLQPDFEWMVSYNLALSWIDTGKERYIEKALKLVRELINRARRGEGTDVLQQIGSKLRLTRPARLKDDLRRPNTLRLITLARSAHAVARTMQMEYLNQQVQFGEKTQKEVEWKMKKTCRRVDVDERWIWNIIDSKSTYKVSDWQTYARAHSAAQNARGRAHFLLKEYEEASKYLRWAVSIHAPEAFAKPFVHMAEVILKQKLNSSEDWAQEVEEYLKRALEINPTHTQAHYLLGLLYADPSEGRYAEAKREFDAAGDYWLSLYEHARILCEQDKDYEGAIRLLNRSLDIKGLADERVFLFCEAISMLADAEKEHLEKGKEWAEYLKTQGLTRALQAQGENLYKILEDKLSTLQKNSINQPG